MIVGNWSGLPRLAKVVRVCDECGRRDETCLNTVLVGRKRRGRDFDCCKRCSYKFRVVSRITGESNSNWKGGRWLTQNGYYRLSSGKYEHKEVMSKHMGRELTSKEKVHHIDMDKTNNCVANLFLCKDKSEHSLIHCSMEDCALQFLDNGVWFDWENMHYSIHPKPAIDRDNLDVSDILSIKCYKEARRTGGKQYLRPTSRAMKSKCLHILVMERIIGRKLFSDETVHHVDGDTLNNSPGNLCLMTRRQHRKCHNSLQACTAILLKSGKIKFENGEYVVP